MKRRLDLAKQWAVRQVRWLDRRTGADLYYAQRLARRVAPRVASGRRAQAKVLAAGLVFGTRRWKRPITLPLDGPQHPIRFTVPDYTGFKVLDEIFYRSEYAVEMPNSPDTILDLGGHVGVSALYFRRRWPNARIVVLEPSPALLPMLRANMAQIGVEVRHGAVAAQSGAVEFVDLGDSWAGQTRPGETGDIPAYAIDDLLAEPVDLMKLDIEGAEFEALPVARKLASVGVIVGEIHAAPGSMEADALLAHLSAFDVVLGESRYVIFTARRKAREHSSTG